MSFDTYNEGKEDVQNPYEPPVGHTQHILSAPFIEAKGPVYALVGAVLDRTNIPENAPIQVLVAAGVGREYDAEFLPVFEFFKTPREEQQVLEWLAWAGGDDEFLKALLDTRAIVRVDTRDPLSAVESFHGLRPVSQYALPDLKFPTVNGVIVVKRDENSESIPMTAELATVLWSEPGGEDLPALVTRISETSQVDRSLTARKILTDLPLMLTHGYAHLELVDISRNGFLPA